jgi:hypothetical protein
LLETHFRHRHIKHYHFRSAFFSATPNSSPLFSFNHLCCLFCVTRSAVSTICRSLPVRGRKRSRKTTMSFAGLFETFICTRFAVNPKTVYLCPTRIFRPQRSFPHQRSSTNFGLCFIASFSPIRVGSSFRLLPTLLLSCTLRLSHSSPWFDTLSITSVLFHRSPCFDLGHFKQL